MPIYAYKCSTCGFAKDALRKISDPPLTTCPECGAETFVKQLTAAGFQLKGSGWYATDFKNGSGAAAAAPAGNSENAENADKSADKSGDSAKTDEGSKPAESRPAETKPAEMKSAATKSAESTAKPAVSAPPPSASKD